jgi:hypothetical protein
LYYFVVIGSDKLIKYTRSWQDNVIDKRVIYLIVLWSA